MKNYRNRLFTLLLSLICAAVLTAGCTQSVMSDASYWPTEAWRTSTPEAQGMDSVKLADMFDYIQESGLDVHSLLIVRNGYLVSEGYFYPYKKEYRHILNSETKSITSALVGLALEDGLIKSLDQKVLDFFPDMKVDNLDDRKKSMTIGHLLTMTTGLDWNESGAYGAANDTNTQMWAQENQLQYVLDRPMKQEPGKSFYYNSGASHILSAIVQKAAGKTPLEYASERIFKPLGITDISWGTDRQGINSGSGRIFMKPEDLAKYGYLYLNKGKWDGKQLIPEKWVQESTKKQVDTPNGLAGRYGYGYQWWQSKFGGYSARGFGGQFLFVMPEYNMVVVFSSGLVPNDFFAPEELVEDYIIPAVKASSAVAENKQAYESLTDKLEFINKAPETSQAPVLPEIGKQISGKTFRMDNGETYSFEFTGGSECKMHWFCDGIMYDVTIGLDNVYRENSMDAFYWKGMTTKAGFRGSWTASDTFMTELIPLEDNNTYRQEFRFSGSKLNAKMIQVMNGAVVTNTDGTAEN